jgi:hypothetical protein
MPTLPPEARLLFLALRPEAGARAAALADLLASRLDWRLVGHLAEREKLLPILWNNLRDHASAIPATIREALHRQSAVTEFRMVMTEAALQRVIETLDAEGIRVMLLKGAAVATTVYPSFAQRPMGDFDVLVDPAEARRAWEVLREEGWGLEVEGGDEFYEHLHHLPGLLDPGGLKLVLEIHRSMLPWGGPFPLDESELWRDARAIRVGATTAWVPSDAHQLLHLSTHLAWSHMFGGIGRTVRDVAALDAARAIDWEAFAELANRTRAGTSAYWTLSLAKLLMDVPIPAPVMRCLRPRPAWLPPRLLERAYLTTGLLSACPSVHVARWLWSAGIRPRRSGHGAFRPWHTNELFKKVFHQELKRGLGERLMGQVHAASRWWKFVRGVGSPRPVL